MSFSQHLVLWLHVAFVIFTIGPVTLAIMSTPRYIRQRDIRILRYLTRMTFAFAAASLGVLIAGLALASMIGIAGKPWIIVSTTLFIVAILLLGLIHRDQRHAVKALEAARAAADAARAGVASDKAVAPSDGQPRPSQAPTAEGPGEAATPADTQADSTGARADAESAASNSESHATNASERIPAQLANVERGRIAMIGGVVSLIWLVILVLMVWNT
jgi:predicted lipid-binding transport protein (Tim44 family)